MYNYGRSWALSNLPSPICIPVSQALVKHHSDTAAHPGCLSCSICWTEIWRGKCLYLIRHKLAAIKVGHSTTGLLKIILWHPHHVLAECCTISGYRVEQKSICLLMLLLLYHMTKSERMEQWTTGDFSSQDPPLWRLKNIQLHALKYSLGFSSRADHYHSKSG